MVIYLLDKYVVRLVYIYSIHTITTVSTEQSLTFHVAYNRTSQLEPPTQICFSLFFFAIGCMFPKHYRLKNPKIFLDFQKILFDSKNPPQIWIFGSRPSLAVLFSNIALDQLAHEKSLSCCKNKIGLIFLCWLPLSRK